VKTVLRTLGKVGVDVGDEDGEGQEG